MLATAAPARLPRPPASVAPYRACELCGHCERVGTSLLCADPALRGRRVPVATARVDGHACGPDARHQQVPGWTF